MLAIIDAAVTDDIDGQDTVFELRKGGENEALVGGAAHGERVVAGSEDQVREEGGADWSGIYGEGEGYVALRWGR